MKRIITIVTLAILSALTCFGQRKVKIISVKELIERHSGSFCVRAEFAGIYDLSMLVFLVNEDDYIIPVRLQKKDLGAEKRFLDLNLEIGDSVYVKGTLDEVFIGAEFYKGLVNASIIDKQDLVSETCGAEMKKSPKTVITDSNKETIPFQLVEVKPQFNGGDANEFAEWVNSHLKYPKVAKENGVQGRVVLQFTVETDGTLSGIEVLRGVDDSLDKEAVRVVSASPKWKPGVHSGKPVRVTYTFPVIFQLR